MSSKLPPTCKCGRPGDEVNYPASDVDGQIVCKECDSVVRKRMLERLKLQQEIMRRHLDAAEEELKTAGVFDSAMAGLIRGAKL